MKWRKTENDELQRRNQFVQSPMVLNPCQIYKDESGNMFISSVPAYNLNSFQPTQGIQPAFHAQPYPGLTSASPFLSYPDRAQLQLIPIEMNQHQYQCQPKPQLQPQYVYSAPNFDPPRPEKPQENNEESNQRTSSDTQSLLSKRQGPKDSFQYVSDSKIGVYSSEERREKIRKYKTKLERWRTTHPIIRSFEGRKAVATQKPRVRGKFIKITGIATAGNAPDIKKEN